ncbi:MAG: hypothetical protein NTW64_02355 [Candidatus Omnitrophica bacterium]|nr:hypothetical protein [Candidatus Omnitrophota bacterium]
MNIIFLSIALVIGIIIWQKWSMKIAKANRLSEEKKQQESLEAEGRKELRAEERILEQGEARKHQIEAEASDLKAKEERDAREEELRRKIKDRKEHEAEEEKRKIEETEKNE